MNFSVLRLYSTRGISVSVPKAMYFLSCGCRDLCLICLGKIHPEIPSLNIQISLALMSIRKDKTAIQFLEQMIELEGNSSGKLKIIERRRQ